MAEQMNLLDDSSCFGGDQCWPPGFRFHPTDEELVLYYLKRKICRRRLKLDIIGETDVYKWDPEELPGQSKLKTGDRQWFFFSPRDRKYPNGVRSNRATRHGYWKATGKDRIITYNSRSVGVKKTLVFYKGRAPTGKRTDWVMHEYTLEEEELKRCQAAKDYYALYKAYKKSGPGPKNGEQYGAPFREEDWADDENTHLNERDMQNSVMQVNKVVSVDNTRDNGCRVQSPFSDLDEFMNGLANESIPVQPLAVDYGYVMQEAVCQEETQSTLVDQSLGEANLNEAGNLLRPSGVLSSFHLTQSTTSQLQLDEASEVTSAPKPHIYKQEPHHTEEDFLEDFIEMDDLIGPEPSTQNDEKPAEKRHFEEIDGLSELDLLQDAAMFIRDMGSFNPGLVSNSNFDAMANDMTPPYAASYVDDINNEVDYQLQPHANGINQTSSQLWMHDNNCNNVMPSETILGTSHMPTSGLVCEGSSANPPGGVNQNQNQNYNQNQSGRENDGAGSWFSSSLWDFVESMPTTPAFASESTALMNKAFERMSSFSRMSSRVMTSAGNTSLSAGNPTETLRKSSSWCARGFYLISLLGAVCAILWVLRGTSVRVLGRCVLL